ETGPRWHLPYVLAALEQRAMAIRNSIIRSTRSLVCSLAALSLWSGCGTDQGTGSTTPGGTAGAQSSTAGGSGPIGSAGSAPTTGGSGPAAGGSSPATGGSAPSAGNGPVGTAGGGTTDPMGGYNPDFVEFVGKDCPVTAPAAVDNAKLPNLFKKADGTMMTKKSEWACRRAELKKAVETFIHGEK